MPPEPKAWKKLRRQKDKGGDVYIGKGDLEDLAAHEDTDLDLDEPIEYSTSHGVSDGRPRVFIQLRNAE